MNQSFKLYKPNTNQHDCQRQGMHPLVILRFVKPLKVNIVPGHSADRNHLKYFSHHSKFARKTALNFALWPDLLWIDCSLILLIKACLETWLDLCAPPISENMKENRCGKTDRIDAI